MHTLLMIAVVLVVLWVLAQFLGWAIGAALHLLLIGAIVLFAIWLYQRMRART